MAFKDFDEELEKSGAQRKSKKPSRAVIMVVDDDPTVRASLEALLSERYEVILCASGSEAMAALRDEISAVVLDIKLKGHDGFSTCEQIQERYPYLPIIFYSAHQDAKDPYKIMNENHPFGFVSKDGNSDELLKKIEMAVKLYKVLQSNDTLIKSLQKKLKPRMT